MNLKQKQQEIDNYYAGMGHVHTGSLDHLKCPSCNPNIKSKILAYIYTCTKCGKQFKVKKHRKEKKRICKNCK